MASAPPSGTPSGEPPVSAAPVVSVNARSRGLAGARRAEALGFGLVLAANVSYGVQAILAKGAYALGLSAVSVLTIRFLLGTALVWLVGWLTRTALGVPLRRLPGLWLLGLIYIGNSLTYYLALERIAAGLAALLLFTYPAMVVVLAWLFLGEALTWAKLGALGLALVGAVLMIGWQGGPLDALGIALALACAGCYSGYVLLSARLTRGVTAPPTVAWSMLSSTVAYTLLALTTAQLRLEPPPAAWSNLIGVALFSAGAIAAFLVGAPRIGPSRAAILGTVEPVVVAVLGTLILGEGLTLPQIAGGGCVLAAVIWLRAR